MTAILLRPQCVNFTNFGWIIPLRPEQHERYFANEGFNTIFLNMNHGSFVQITRKFVHSRSPIDKKSGLAWCQRGESHYPNQCETTLSKQYRVNRSHRVISSRSACYDTCHTIGNDLIVSAGTAVKIVNNVFKIMHGIPLTTQQLFIKSLNDYTNF